MSFTIVAAVTPNYLNILNYCLPSWHRNSGASKIIVSHLPAINGPREESWYDNTAARCVSHRDNIIDCLNRGERVLALDVDCVVLQDLSGGFSDEHPISVARWPNINMGVMFFRASGARERSLLASRLNHVSFSVKQQCHQFRGTLRPAGGCQLADQDVWKTYLHEREQDVCKLDANEWNFCPLAGDWETEWDKHKDSVRIVHLKGQGQPEGHVVPKRLLDRDYGGEF